MMNHSQVARRPKADPIAARTVARVTRRLIPFMFLLYVINFLDRVNIGYAALDMTRELHFSNEVFGFGAGIFFVGYVVLQIPGTMFIERWSARKWIALILIVWGVLASASGFIQTARQLYGVRFLLGAAEAGFFPGMIVYLTHWYRPEDRGKATAMFMAAMPVSNIVGAPLAGLLMKIHWLDYPGWRWLLVLEGLPAIVLGVVTLFYLTDRPEGARWLRDDERHWLVSEQARARRAIAATAPPMTAWQALGNARVVQLALVYFFMMTSMYGVSLWLPKIVQALSGLSTLQVTLVAGIPYLAALPAMLVAGWHSDKTGERRLHCGLPMFFVALGLGMSQVAGAHVATAIAMFALAAVGIYTSLAPFWSLPTLFLTEAAAAAGIALINSVGNLGGFVGPYLVGFVSARTGTYTAGVLYLVGSACLAGMLLVRIPDGGRTSLRPDNVASQAPLRNTRKRPV
jgi:MFS transporter, ACS family, tartrate transporter